MDPWGFLLPNEILSGYIRACINSLFLKIRTTQTFQGTLFGKLNIGLVGETKWKYVIYRKYEKINKKNFQLIVLFFLLFL